MSGRSTALALLAAVFFAGVATTLGVLRVVENRREPAAMDARPAFRGESRQGPPRRPVSLGESRRFMELARMQVTEHMTEAMDLTEEQRLRIEAAMDRSRLAGQEAMAEVLPLLQAQMDSLQAEIERILTPEQREAFQEFRREDRDRFRRGGGRRPGPPGAR